MFFDPSAFDQPGGADVTPKHDNDGDEFAFDLSQVSNDFLDKERIKKQRLAFQTRVFVTVLDFTSPEGTGGHPGDEFLKHVTELIAGACRLQFVSQRSDHIGIIATGATFKESESIDATCLSATILGVESLDLKRLQAIVDIADNPGRLRDSIVQGSTVIDDFSGCQSIMRGLLAAQTAIKTYGKSKAAQREILILTCAPGPETWSHKEREDISTLVRDITKTKAVVRIIPLRVVDAPEDCDAGGWREIILGAPEKALTHQEATRAMYEVWLGDKSRFSYSVRLKLGDSWLPLAAAPVAVASGKPITAPYYVRMNDSALVKPHRVYFSSTTGEAVSHADVESKLIVGGCPLDYGTEVKRKIYGDKFTLGAPMDILGEIVPLSLIDYPGGESVKATAILRDLGAMKTVQALYPLEGKLEGSWRLYCALLDELRRRCAALTCSMRLREAARPQLVLLIPGGDMDPDCLYAVPISYRCNRRDLSGNVSQHDGMRDVATNTREDDVATWEAVLATAEEPLTPFEMNPVFHRRLQTLEILALDHEFSSFDHVKKEWSSFSTGSTEMEELTRRFAAMRKRASPGSGDRNSDEIVAAVEEAWRGGRLGKLKVVDMKTYCALQQVSSMGRKVDLIERITEFNKQKSNI